MRNKIRFPDLPFWLSIGGLLAMSTVWTVWLILEMRT
jgi:hypothetical protein